MKIADKKLLIEALKAAASGFGFGLIIIFIRLWAKIATLGKEAVFKGDVSLFGLPVAFLEYDHKGFAFSLHARHLVLPILCALVAAVVAVLLKKSKKS